MQTAGPHGSETADGTGIGGAVHGSRYTEQCLGDGSADCNGGVPVSG